MDIASRYRTKWSMERLDGKLFASLVPQLLVAEVELTPLSSVPLRHFIFTSPKFVRFHTRCTRGAELLQATGDALIFYRSRKLY